MAADRDYVLGTDEEEVVRLGVQHRVWRPIVSACWDRAGITVGKRIVDVGAGPGYAAVDLAEIVGPKGEVMAVERSPTFVAALQDACGARALRNVRIEQLDLMTDDLPAGDFDFSWCRWVLAFVADPALLLRKIAGALRPNGVAIFYEYAAYSTWSFLPPKPTHQKFVRIVMESWRESGGEADVGRQLPQLLSENGFVLQSITPRVFAITPGDYMWQWPASFIETGTGRLQQLGYIDRQLSLDLRQEFAEAEKAPETLMLTPLVLEVVAVRP